MKYINDDYLLMRYLGLSTGEISRLTPLDRNMYLRAIKTNLSKKKAFERAKMIKRLF